jgi:DNA-binding transcriptional LysR family regulator
VQEAIEVPTLLSLVAAGIGVFLPIEFFSRLALPGVVYRPVEGAPIVEIVAVWHRGEGRSPVVRAFLTVAGDVLAAH